MNRWRCLAMLAGLLLWAGSGFAANTDFLYNGKFGLHFQYNAPSISQNDAAANIWVDDKLGTFVGKTDLADASWVMVSIGSQNGLYCAPNWKYEQLVGDSDATSARDLPDALYANLNPEGIKLIFRIGLDTANFNTNWAQTMGWDYGTETYPTFIDGIPTQTYVDNLCDVLEVWGDRYGSKLAGWWFDHAYEEMGWTQVQLEQLAVAGRVGSSSRIVTFNNGHGVYRYTDEDDYTAGEMPAVDSYTPSSRWADGAQWHGFTYMGNGWGDASVRYYNDEVIDQLVAVAENGGAYTLNVTSNFGTTSDQYYQAYGIGVALKGRMPDSFKHYAFVSKYSGKAMRVNSLYQGATVYQDDRSRDTYKMYVPVSLGGGLWRIKNEMSQKFLAPDSFSSGSVSVKQYNWDSAEPTMQWVLVHDGGGWFRIKNNSSQKFLTVTDDQNGSDVLVQNWQGIDQQRWRLISVDKGDALQ